MTKKHIVFIGSSNAMKPRIILENLIDSLRDNYIISVITTTNGGEFNNYIIKNGLNKILIDPLKLNKESIRHLSKPDLLISLGWPRKISDEVLTEFNFGGINCHGSYLPDYRGQRSYMHYWANIEEYYGASIHYMTNKFDDGNIIIRKKIKLFIEETPEILHHRTSELCALMLPEAIEKVFNGEAGYSPKEKSRFFKSLTHDEYSYIRNKNLKNPKSASTPFKVIK